MDVYGWVRRAVQVEGRSVRRTARDFGLSRKTVRKMLMYSAPPGYRRNKPAARPKLGPWLGVIDQILEDNESQPKKQRHTAKRIYDRLKEEYRFTGGYTIVKDYVREARLRHKEVFVPLAHPPGDAQADFGEALAVIEGVEQKAHFVCVDLPHSDDAFVVAFPAETTEPFCEGHNQAFAYFAGVPRSILYCNESLYSPPPRAIFVTMFPAFVARRNRLAASQARRPPGGVLSDFFGEALERRPWAFKRKSPPEGRSELTSVDAVSLTEKNLRTNGASVVTRYTCLCTVLKQTHTAPRSQIFSGPISQNIVHLLSGRWLNGATFY